MSRKAKLERVAKGLLGRLVEAETGKQFEAMPHEIGKDGLSTFRSESWR